MNVSFYSNSFYFYIRACYGVLRFIMESGAKGCEVVVSGKLRGQRAKSMKFVDGLMIHSGQPVREYVDTAVRHVLLRQGVLGVKVKIMLPFDPTGKTGPKRPLPDHVNIVEPKEEEPIEGPCSEAKNVKLPPAEPIQVPSQTQAVSMQAPVASAGVGLGVVPQ